MNKSTLSDAERSSLAHMSYPVSPITPVKGNVGSWISVADPVELSNGLELYTLRKPGTKEVVFAVRGSDFTPNAAADWSPLDGANIAFKGSLHPQLQKAIEHVKKIMGDHEGEGLIYSTTGHSKGGGFGQVIAHTFGFEGTALDPAPAGAVVESQEYLDFVYSLGIQPHGIPEHGFTNYVEKGSLVGDTLENLTIFGFGTGAHLGDTVRVDMASGSWWWNSDILEQHSTVDDTFSQATQGAASVVGKALENALGERQQLLERQAQLQAESEVLDNTDYFVTAPELINIENELKECDQEIAKLTVIRLNKLQEEYGTVDNWMRQADFQVSDPSPQVIENLTRYYQNGISDVVDGSLYLNSKELLSLEKDGKALENKIAAMGGSNAYENVDTLHLESQLRQLNSRIHEIQEQQQELLQHKYGDQLDSWMKTDSFLEKAIPEKSSLDSLSSNDKAIIQNPDTLHKLLQEQAILQKGGQALTSIEPENSAQQQSVNSGGSDVVAFSSSYVIQPGDTLSEIDKQHNTTVGDLLLYNPEIDDPGKIFTGDELIIPPDDWEYPALQPITDADGNPILLASTDGAIVEEILRESEESGQKNEALDEDFAEIDQKTSGGETEAENTPETPQSDFQPKENADDLARKEAEAQHQLDVEAGERTRGADLDVIYAQNGFSDAISSGDGLSIIGAGIDYYAKLEDRADLGRGGYAEDSGSLSTSEEALLDSVGSAIGLGQAIDEGDSLVIAGESIDLLRNIDCYLDETKSDYGKVIGTTGSAVLSLGVAGIGLAQAIENGNDLGIAKSSVELLEGIDNYIGGSTALDTALGFDTGDALKGVGSAIGLAINISRLDDVFESGDTGAIACSVAGTVSSAIGTYNAVAAMAGASGIAGSAVPVLGFVTAGIQLMQGDVVGAAFSAASAAVAMAVACGLMTTGIGAIAGLAIMAIQMLIADDDPPEASATFSLDADGNLVMETHGDSAMRETAGAYGNPMIALMENYQQNGGRLLIEGSLPTLRVVQGENSAIEYRSVTGGRVSVVLSDMSQAMQEMSAALYARDRGERLDSAVEISRDVDGDIDLAEVDRIMAGHGFGKTGMTYTYGETKELTGFSFGSGVFKGGGNVGPEGQHFVARDQDIKSLPLRNDQRPSQTMGEIIKIVGLNNAFAGAGAELLAMAMISGGLLGLAAPAGAAPIVETNGDWTRPLDGLDLENYLLNPRQFREETGEKESGNAQPMPALTDPTQMHRFLQEHWGELLRNPADFTEIPDSAYFYRQPIGFDGLRSDGTRPGWIGPSHQDDLLLHQQTAAQGQPDEILADEEIGHAAGASFTGYRVALDPADAANGPRQESGPVFIMAEDSSLRFLLSELTEETTSGSYGRSEDGFTFVSFGRVENGRVYQEANGDIRFEPTPGFVGTGSFTYTVRNAAGELIEKQATVQVENVNDSLQLQDDAFTLIEGEPFYLDTLLANDSDPEGDPMTIDHLRGLAHGEISLSDGSLVFIPEEGYHGDVEFSYWVRDHTSSYPVMATATLTYLDRNTGVSTGDDRFIVLEDHSLTAKLLANDIEHDSEKIHFTGLGAAVHGEVAMQPDGSILFTPDWQCEVA